MFLWIAIEVPLRVTSHSYDYIAPLQFFTRIYTTMSAGQGASRTCSIPMI